jgi:SAM-dependent methyltransferase
LAAVVIGRFRQSVKQRSIALTYGRETIAGWARSLPGTSPVIAFDIGCGVGSDLLGVRKALAPREVSLAGIDLYEPSIDKARAAGIDVHTADIEKDCLPLEDGSVDIVVANQVLEHVKEIFWVIAEMERVLRTGGLLCVGVPNLASLHNRLLLAFGRQPTSIEPIGPHVRGFTLPALRRLLTAGGFFTVEDTAGGNFYPLPSAPARAAARAWPGAAVSIFALARKTGQSGNYLDIIGPGLAETQFRR